MGRLNVLSYNFNKDNNTFYASVYNLSEITERNIIITNEESGNRHEFIFDKREEDKLYFKDKENKLFLILEE